MLSGEKFKYYMNIIKNLEEKEDLFRHTVDKLSDGESGLSFIYNQPIIALINLLYECFNITCKHSEDDIISYFIYDLDWGTDEMSKNCITYEDGTQASLTNFDELYDYMVKLKAECEL